mgnify:CR=1 FL=1
MECPIASASYGHDIVYMEIHRNILIDKSTTISEIY